MVNRIIKMVQTIVIAYFMSAILLVVLALAAYKMGMGEKIVSIGIYAVYVISTCAAGMIIGAKMRSARAIWGIAAGAVYYMIIFIVSLILNKGIAQNVSEILTALVLCILGGFIGGFFSGSVKK